MFISWIEYKSTNKEILHLTLRIFNLLIPQFRKPVMFRNHNIIVRRKMKAVKRAVADTQNATYHDCQRSAATHRLHTCSWASILKFTTITKETYIDSWGVTFLDAWIEESFLIPEVMLDIDRKNGSVDSTTVITIQSNMEESTNIEKKKYDVEH